MVGGDMVTIDDLHQNTHALVKAAAAGKRLLITERGRPIAVLSGVPRSPLQQLIAAGDARLPTRNLRDLSAPASPTRPALSQVLEHMRDDERY
jgi:prevent-host-death family protein